MTLFAADSPAIWRSSVSTSNSPARRVSCMTVVSGGLVRLAAGNVVEADHRTCRGTSMPGFLQGAQRADGDEIAGGDDGVELDAARAQLAGGLEAGFLVVMASTCSAEEVGDARFHHRALVAAVAIEEFRVVSGRVCRETRCVGGPAPAGGA